MKIIDEPLLDEFRYAKRCEWCKRKSPGRLEPHHIFCKGMGSGSRLDIRLNLLALCLYCHRAYHDGAILRCDILAVVAARENTTQDAIEREIYRLRREPKT